MFKKKVLKLNSKRLGGLVVTEFLQDKLICTYKIFLNNKKL